MNDFMYKIMKFFEGRHGFDQMSKGLVLLAAVVAVFNLFFRLAVLKLVVYAIVVYALFRAMSRNHQKRRAENDWFVNLRGNTQKSYRKAKAKREDKKTHVYFTCPGCKKTLRLPKIKGKHTGKCPNCNQEFKIKI